MKVVVGWFLIGIGLFMSLGFYLEGLDPNWSVDLITFIIAILVPFGLGYYFLTESKKKPKNLRAELFRLAAQESGRLTVLDVVKGLGLDKISAEQALDEMALEQFAEHQMTQDGLLVYVFKDSSSKENARSIGDF